MTRPPVEDVPRPPRGADSPWRLKGTGRPGRAVPTLAAGPPSLNVLGEPLRSWPAVGAAVVQLTRSMAA